MKKRMTKFWVLYHIALLIFSVGAGMLMKYNQTGDALHPTVVVAIIVIFLSSVGIGYLAVFMVNKAKSFKTSQLIKWIVPALLVFYLAALLIANLSVTIAVFGWYIYSGKSLDGFWPQMFHHELNYANGSLIRWLFFFTLILFYVLWLKSSKREQKLAEENLKYRYSTLKSQVNPHFLFNSLNVLSELVYTDPQKADNYIQTLSGIYRYVLENEEAELIDLEKELAFVQQYFSLQQVRDGDKIELAIDIASPQGIRIIPMSLQILIENALKHNSVSLERPLRISIGLKDNCIVVTNPIQRKNILESSTQIGLSNLKNRTKILFGSELRIDDQNNTFTVELPIQKQK